MMAVMKKRPENVFFPFCDRLPVVSGQNNAIESGKVSKVSGQPVVLSLQDCRSLITDNRPLLTAILSFFPNLYGI